MTDKETIDKLKSLVLRLYRHEEDLEKLIDSVACTYCSYNSKNGCTVINQLGCQQTDEEAIDLFLKYGGIK